MADNISFDMTGVPLRLALGVALNSHSKVVGWSIDSDKGFMLYWSPSEVSTPFPTALDLDEVLPLIEKWLETATYPPKPSIDGSVDKGWRVYNEAWGHVNNEWRAFAAIQPVWLLYGK